MLNVKNQIQNCAKSKSKTQNLPCSHFDVRLSNCVLFALVGNAYQINFA